MKYALLSYSSVNLGDEIQSLAARQYLPQVDLLLDRDQPSTWKIDQPTKLILNGWFKHRPEDWPIHHPALDPLIVSFHLSDEHGSSLRSLLSADAIRFYKQHEPIGCRDHHTLNLLSECGVQAYFSGCLTLTLPRPVVAPSNTIALVDVPPDIEPLLPPHHGCRVVPATHVYRGTSRFRQASSLLRLYASARLVVTTRMHCALPCLAFGTPVIFIRETFDDPRFGGLVELLSCAALPDLRSGHVQLRLDELPRQPQRLQAVQEAIAKCCIDFLGPPEPRSAASGSLPKS